MPDLQETMAAEYLGAATMNAIGITDYPEIGKVADHLKMLTVGIPVPGEREVVVKLAASALHIDEIYAAQGTAFGRFNGPKHVSEVKPHILGSSVSGAIVSLGKDVEGLSVGDEVIAIPNEHGEFGSWATYRCIDQDWLMTKPAALTASWFQPTREQAAPGGANGHRVTHGSALP